MILSSYKVILLLLMWLNNVLPNYISTTPTEDATDVQQFVKT